MDTWQRMEYKYLIINHMKDNLCGVKMVKEKLRHYTTLDLLRLLINIFPSEYVIMETGQFYFLLEDINCLSFERKGELRWK